MVDGASSLMAAAYGMFAGGLLTNKRGENVLDSGAYFMKPMSAWTESSYRWRQ